MKIMKANPDHLQVIIGMDAIAQKSSARKALISQSINTNQCWLAQVNDEMVGFMIKDNDFFEYDFVKLITVAESHRCKGIARQLIEAAISNCHTSKLFSSCNASNKIGNRLFLSCNFRISGVITGLDENDQEIIYYYSKI